MDKALSTWLSQRQCRLLDETIATTSRLQKSYVVYGCMLLLPSVATSILAQDPAISSADLQNLYELLAVHLKVTHIAVTKPIPLRRNQSSSDRSGEENTLRSPSDFAPLYGDVGPASCSNPPTQADFDSAFWVTAKQNGIFQTWAPRWIMFSRGNISEKARLLGLHSVAEAVVRGREDGGEGCTAVDLYVGIGYFAFSYAKAGVEKVLGWDLNAWSCEGLRRGARANGWKAVVLDGEDAGLREVVEDHETTFIVFNESNEYAVARVDSMRSRLPPVRHVNCGLLPTSRGSWGTAVQVLDQRLGGWIHVHENFAINEIEERAEEVRAEIESSLVQSHNRGRSVEVEHVNRLKSYAPGVIHCVLDIYIPPLGSAG